MSSKSEARCVKMEVQDEPVVSFSSVTISSQLISSIGAATAGARSSGVWQSAHVLSARTLPQQGLPGFRGAFWVRFQALGVVSRQYKATWQNEGQQTMCNWSDCSCSRVYVLCCIVLILQTVQLGAGWLCCSKTTETDRGLWWACRLTVYQYPTQQSDMKHPECVCIY